MRALLVLLFAFPLTAQAIIRWEPFPLPGGGEKLRAQLGRLTVPLNRARPDAGSAELAFVRLQSGGTGAPIVYLAKLEKEPMPVTITDRALKKEVEVRIGPAVLRGILVLDIGDGNDFPVFPALLLTIERGDPSILAWFVDKRYNQSPAIDLMSFGMRCSGGATPKRDEEIRLQATESVLGNALNGVYPEICGALPRSTSATRFAGRSSRTFPCSS